MSIQLFEHMESIGAIKIYGLLVDDMVAVSKLSVGINSYGKKINLAQIRAYSIGSVCISLRNPMLLIVFGDGDDVEEGDFCGRKGEKAWTVYQKDETFCFEVKKGEIFDLLEDVETKGVSGGVAIDDPRIEGGNVKATIRIWAKIEILGAKVSVNERFPISIPLQGCYPVFEFGFGSVNACIKSPTANGLNLCVELCVGKWGISKCWDACTYIGFFTKADTMSISECDCKN